MIQVKLVKISKISNNITIELEQAINSELKELTYKVNKVLDVKVLSGLNTVSNLYFLITYERTERIK